MKRIALLFLIGISFVGFSFVGCNNIVDPDVSDPGGDPRGSEPKQISLKIHIPPNSVKTYASTDASVAENTVDSIFIDLYKAGSIVHQDTITTFVTSELDSIIQVGYEVDNVGVGPFEARVYANKRQPARLPNNTEVPIPNPPSQRETYFYMSGMDSVRLQTNAYRGDVHLVRNVAKLRVHISKNSIFFPSDLKIDYDKIRIQVVNTPDSTSAFDGNILDLLPSRYISYPERTSTALRRHATFSGNTVVGGVITTEGTGGIIDSLYLYENRRTGYDVSGNTNTTRIKVVIPTQSATEGIKEATIYYTLKTSTSVLHVLRNYIYTLDIKVQGQGSDPLIMLNVSPWVDAPYYSPIEGTYLNLDNHDISFNLFANTANHTVNFCTDAQAIYFDFSDFNNNNPGFKIREKIKLVGIDTSLTTFPLAPPGFQDGQILLDKQHCGSFSFELAEGGAEAFDAQLYNFNYSGKICMKAGNIETCIIIPAQVTYDAHFIVGEPLFPGAKFTDAVTSDSWIEVSTSRLYTNATQNFHSSVPSGELLYLHLDECLENPYGYRTGSITLTNSFTHDEKKIYIKQLSAFSVGRFGFNINTPPTDDSIFNAPLYMEHLYEFTEMPVFNTTGSGVLPGNALYNGRFTAINPTVLDVNRYNNGTFNYHNTTWEAINYCAYKNRGTNPDGTLRIPQDIKWHLPSQAQLMGIWVSNKHVTDNWNQWSNFFTMVNEGSVPTKKYADIFWSSTDNTGYASQAQYVDFRYGNVGHYEKGLKHWARCVRDGNTDTDSHFFYGQEIIPPSNPWWSGGGIVPFVRVHLGPSPGDNPLLPSGAVTTASKYFVVGNENDVVNQTVYDQLRVANKDMPGYYTWDISSTGPCSSYFSIEPSTYTERPWRLPTQRELQVIWILQDEIYKEAEFYLNNLFNKLSNDYYWTATEASTTNHNSAWTVFGGKTPIGGAGNTPHQVKTTPLKVRCVREL